MPMNTLASKAANAMITLVALSFIFLFLILPILVILQQGFSEGVVAWWQNISDEETLLALRLTLTVAAIAVPLNLLFGIMIAWTIAKFQFRGRELLLTLIDLPLAIPPIISGLMYVLLFGIYGWFGAFFNNYDVQIIYAVPGIILVTIFVTLPYVARELIPLLSKQGTEEELAAISLGASGLQTFWRVTLPNVKWGILHGIILCNARAMGEFGAVAVVSGHIRGETNTLPLHIEILYNEYNFVAAFAISSLFVSLATITLLLKGMSSEHHSKKH
ncbi:MAG: sulfate ABC transporter permease subunit CysW [Oligoflexia bacterium]|nr:sulfate ABC transporter permease subunit CysW [Oligoflexia bacterium]MBF0365844.1 sulfate ABC transporter permease subunit CysW [Oligoflexia bacterium]